MGAYPLKARVICAAYSSGAFAVQSDIKETLCALVVFAELVTHQLGQRVEGGFGVRAFGPDRDAGADMGGEHHKAHDGRAGNGLAIARDFDFGLKCFANNLSLIFTHLPQTGQTPCVGSIGILFIHFISASSPRRPESPPGSQPNKAPSPQAWILIHRLR